MKKNAALRLVDTRTLDRQQWLSVRQGGIGSSDAAAAVGLCPYKSRWNCGWRRPGGRRGNAPPGMDDPRYWGTLLEPYVAVAYSQQTGRKVRKVNAVLQHPTFPYMLANIDREVVGCPDVQILECKTAGEWGSKLWQDGVPEYIQLQVQHQLAVTNQQAADVAVLLCGQRLEIHRIERDEEVIARLMVLEARFWQYVETDIAPPADGSESVGQGAAPAVSRWRQHAGLLREPRAVGHLRRAGGPEGRAGVRGKHAEQLKQTLQQAMGDAARAVFATGEVTFKRAQDGTSLDTKRLAQDHPDLVARYSVPNPAPPVPDLGQGRSPLGELPC
jgi:putative phage-type endonuclease